MLELTRNYLDNPYADVYVYFSSSRFAFDTPPNDTLIAGYHGHSLSEWLREKLIEKGYRVMAPEPGKAGWTFLYVNCRYQWVVICENLIKHDATEWKITVNSKAKDANGKNGVPPDECLAFLKSIKQALDDDPAIYAIEWNRAVLNEESARTEPAKTVSEFDDVT